MSNASIDNDPVLNGQAWRDFCAELANVGDMILDPGNPSNPIDRAEGFRYLTRLLRLGLEQQIEARDMSFPFFYQLSHTTGKIGADNPDNVYWNARISGNYEYRITVKRGTMAYFSILANAFRYQEDGTNLATGKLIDSDIEWDANGVAEIIASCNPQPKNWLRLEPDANMIIVRQSYLDRATEKPGEFKIERIGGPAMPAPLAPEALGAGLKETISFLRGIVGTFIDWSKMFRENPNAFPDIDQGMFQKGGGATDIFYAHAYWQIAEDEAWVIEVTPPECYYWNFQLDNWWMESLDYRFVNCTVNKTTAKLEPDGKLIIVVAAEDPGFGNWITPAGHTEGTALLRWAGANEHPLPQAKVVKLADIRR
ncbi:hypothetical protein [Caenibius sp. WL]|uniref:hypothetical protein n=1 Tax=Caenibius sp. WL TaxID=2872646 RepID=UPI001C996519|nr:hypothetical protein [Caenibius sp. WL]QZP07048.1 hypothetical protein K5X80_10030 [Caenibius sp. WL]